MIVNEPTIIDKPTVVETLEDIGRYANRAPGTVLHIEDLSLAMPYIKDFQIYLRLRLTINIQSAQRRLRDKISPDTAAYLKKQIAKSQLLQEQLALPKEQRDPISQIEIDGHRDYFKKTRNW